MMNGKGDDRRPCMVSDELMSINHELAFGDHTPEEKMRLAFLADLVEVYDKHGFALSHEDTQGAFIVEPRSAMLVEWLMQARIKLRRANR